MTKAIEPRQPRNLADTVTYGIVGAIILGAIFAFMFLQ
jgi:hypothetical protein